MSSKTKKIGKNAELNKLRNNLNMLMMYFREYDILEHYLKWVEAKAKNTDIPEKLKLDE